jgi:hypothetical protein
MANARSFFDEFESNIRTLEDAFYKYRGGVFEDPENLLELMEITIERLFAEIVYHRSKRALEYRKRSIRTEMLGKAQKEDGRYA